MATCDPIRNIKFQTLKKSPDNTNTVQILDSDIRYQNNNYNFNFDSTNFSTLIATLKQITIYFVNLNVSESLHKHVAEKTSP